MRFLSKYRLGRLKNPQALWRFTSISRAEFTRLSETERWRLVRRLQRHYQDVYARQNPLERLVLLPPLNRHRKHWRLHHVRGADILSGAAYHNNYALNGSANPGVYVWHRSVQSLYVGLTTINMAVRLYDDPYHPMHVHGLRPDDDVRFIECRMCHCLEPILIRWFDPLYNKHHKTLW
jgi:hypothetical protein